MMEKKWRGEGWHITDRTRFSFIWCTLRMENMKVRRRERLGD